MVEIIMAHNRYTRVSLASDIQSMLWGLGDSKTPSLSTARAIETVIKRRMHTLIQKADEIPKRGSNKIDIKAILYAMKNDKSKLARLLEFLDVKDSLSWNVNDKRISELIYFSDNLQMNKMSKGAAINYLWSIGIDDIEDSAKNDGIVMERKIRADRISRSLDYQDYIEFTKSRMLSFVSNSLRRRKFVEWLKLENDATINRLKKNVIDVIAYLAKDTIAELVDLVLFQRKNGKINVNELRTQSGDMYSTISMLTATVDKVQQDFSPISPKEIKAASIHLC